MGKWKELTERMTDEEYEQALADEGQRRMLEIDTEVREMIKEAVEAEREACAKLCDEMHSNAEDSCGKAADAIRERGAPALEKLNKAAEDNGEPL